MVRVRRIQSEKIKKVKNVLEKFTRPRVCRLTESFTAVRRVRLAGTGFPGKAFPESWHFSGRLEPDPNSVDG